MSFKLFRDMLSPDLLKKLRILRRKIKHIEWRLSSLFNDKPVQKSEIVQQLKSLGVREGQDLMVHSSLSQIGVVKGGADTMVDSLLLAIGSNGTLLMPAYPMDGSMLETIENKIIFDVLSTPSKMGKITEALRMRPGSLRSAHPTHSVVAFGPNAHKYIHSHHTCKNPFGSKSPFGLLSENGGSILCIGSGIGKVTSHHVIENKIDNYPLNVYLPKTYSKKVRLADGHLTEAETLILDPKYSALRIDSNKNIEKEVLDDMRLAGIVREGNIGGAKAYLFKASSLDELHESRLEKGKTIYAVQ